MKLDFDKAMAESLPLLQQAEQLLRRRLSDDPGDWKTGLKLAETLRQMGELAQALNSYEKVLQLNPENFLAQRLCRILSGRDTERHIDTLR